MGVGVFGRARWKKKKNLCVGVRCREVVPDYCAGQVASATPAARAGLVTAGRGRLLHTVDCALSVQRISLACFQSAACDAWSSCDFAQASAFSFLAPHWQVTFSPDADLSASAAADLASVTLVSAGAMALVAVFQAVVFESHTFFFWM